jgi:DNA polymerase (family X)
MKNLEVAKIFERTADVLALLDENAFRILAYRKIARTLEELPQAIEKLAESGELDSVPGIGKSSAEKIQEFLRTGKVAEFDDLLAQIPPGVLEILRIPSVGPKTAMLLWREGGITTVEMLKAGIEKKSLLNIKGVGEKKLQKILENLQHLAASSGRIRLGEALPIAEEFTAFLRTLPGVRDATYCGSLRRGKDTIGDIDIAVSSPLDNGPAIAAAVTKHAMTGSIIQVGASKTSIRTGNGVQIDVRVVPPESFGAALQYFTGSLAHNVKLRELAIKKGLKLNEWGVFRVEKEKEIKIAGETETDVYAALDLAFVPPEMREDRGEIEWARSPFTPSAGPEAAKQKSAKVKQTPAAKGKSAANADGKPTLELVEVSHIRGDLHMHTTASDGTNSIEELIGEAKRRGYQYIAITDHSKSQFQANGLKADRLLEHIQKIRAAAKAAEKSGILVLAGSEVDILADGSLDYEDDLLAKLDWVVASPHAALSQESDPATARLARAASNPYVCIIGHPTGRIVPSRRGLEPDMAKVIFAAARHGIALEINANFHRLDLRDTHARMAVEAYVPLCINTDSHSLEEFDQMRYGVLTARRAWATPADVLNTWPREKFQKWLKDRKQTGDW